jgi:CAAX prenyl protease-like protein
MVITAFSSGFATLYPLGVLATAAVLWRFRGNYEAFTRDVRWHAIGIGAAVFILWLILMPSDDGSGDVLAGRLAEMPVGLAVLWLGFRVIGSVITVPLAEELAFRGYFIRKLVAKDFENVQSGHFTWTSFLVSSLLFGLLHDNWAAGTVAGAGFAIALYQRGKISDAIVAHMTSNALIAVAVLGFGRWSLWS